MKARLMALMAMLLGVFGITAGAATKIAANGGCCPFCK